MSALDSAVQEFFDTARLARLPLDHHGLLGFQDERGSWITFVRAGSIHDPELSVVVSRSTGYEHAARIRSAMRLANARLQNGEPVMVATDADQLLLGTRLTRRDVSGRGIALALQKLNEMHAKVETFA